MDGTASPLFEVDVIPADIVPQSWARTGDVITFRFRVIGKPKPKARPRFRRTPNFVQTYTPETTVNWEQTIVGQVKEALAGLSVTHPGQLEHLPFSQRILADVRINCARPKSAPKSLEFPMKAQPGDVDNLAKSVLDALQLAGVIQDDKTVTDLFACKRFATNEHPEGVEVELIAWI